MSGPPSGSANLRAAPFRRCTTILGLSSQAVRAVAILFAAVLVGCGGGGGTSSDGGPAPPPPPPAPTFAITLNKSSLNFDVTVGVAPSSQTIVASANVAPTSDVYIAAIVEGTAIDPNVGILTSGLTATVEVRPRNSLAIGDYSGRVLLLACSDSVCNNRIGGTPLPIAYAVHVRPPLGISPTPIAMTAVVGQTASRALTVQFPLDGAAYSASVMGSPDWLTISQQTPTGFQINARALPEGVYSARLQVTSGSLTYESPLTHTVTRAPTVALATVSGQTVTANLPAPLGVSATSYTATVTSGAEWLSVTQQTVGQAQITARSLPVGQYTGAVSIVSGSSTSIFNVTYAVTAPPAGQRELSVSPSSLSFGAFEGTSSTQALTVTNASWNPTLSVNVDYGSGPKNWLTVSPTSTGYDLVASAAGLISTGSPYRATVSVNPGWPRQPVQVNVTLTVGIGMQQPADIERVITAGTTVGQLSGSVSVNLVAGPAVSWTAVDDASWLTLTRAAGATGTNLQYAIDVAALRALPNFRRHIATVTVTPTPASMTPVSFLVIVDKRFAEVTSLGPFHIVSGQPSELFVRGRGFDALVDIQSDVHVDGATPTTIQLVNDTELRLQLPSLSPGTYMVSVDNAIGGTTERRAFKVVAPQTYAYAAFPNNGFVGSMTFDPVNRTLFAVNTDRNQLQYFHYTGGTWTPLTLDVPLIRNVGLVDVGNSLLVTGGDGTFRLFDPATLSLQQSFTNALGYVSPDRNGAAIPVMNDGRAFLTAGNGHSIGYVNPLTREFGDVEATMYLDFQSGIVYVPSRNGERLVVGETAGGISSTDVFYLDARDSVLRHSTGDLQFIASGTSNDDGSRILSDALRVYDQQLNFVGELPYDSSDFMRRTHIISPDGTRAYVLVTMWPDLGYDDEPPVSHPQRVYVYDTTGGSGVVPELGYFEVPDHVTCRAMYACRMAVVSAISPDGKTLFVAGDKKILVVPIPANLTIDPNHVSQSSVQKLSTPAMTKPLRWPVSAKQP